MPQEPPPPPHRRLDLAALRDRIAAHKTPPVDRWDPPHCGHSGMRIARDGTWYHEGAPIRREAMVRLFSTILRREADGSHVLVTPVEKLTIDVESTAFRAIAMTSSGEGRDRTIALTLDSGDMVIAGPACPLILDAGPASPRIAVRHGLEAQIARPVYYELAEIALREGASPPGVWSDGRFFAMADRE